jgi:hypothetical protein
MNSNFELTVTGGETVLARNTPWSEAGALDEAGGAGNATIGGTGAKEMPSRFSALSLAGAGRTEI